MTRFRTAAMGGALLALAASVLPAQDRATKVRNDRARLESDESWIYNDLPRGLAEAKQTGKPLLVIFRCVPCEACSEFDEQVLRRDNAARPLMDQFVCVRLPQANAMDLTQFQFDYDQSFAVFLMNADGTIYGRFGTRSGRDNEDQDMTMEGFGKALAAALELHQNYPANKAALAAKRGQPQEYKVPEEYPSLRTYGPKLDYAGNVVKSCIHCHQVREAQRLVFRTAHEAIPDRVLFPWPMPAVVGLQFDPKEKALVKSVAPNSSAARDGWKAGDEILTLQGQPVISIADVQWAIQNAGETARIPAEARRGGKTIDLTLTLDDGWRRRSDISWRATSWDLRRMATGGLVLEDLPDEDRREQNLPADQLALRVKHVGQYGAHAVAKQAGFQKGDIITVVNGRQDRLSESLFLAYVLQDLAGEKQLPVTVLRDGKPRQMTLPLQ